MRAFISLNLPENIKKEIAASQQALKKEGIQAHWVNPEIVHLTLAFLGLIKPQQVEPLGKILKKTASQIKPARLKLYRLDGFPDLTKIRILFIALNGELDKLYGLAAKIRQKLKKEKIWFDAKPFTPHLTLGRFKNRLNLNEIIFKTKIKKVEFTADEISLTESRLTSSGPVYHQLKTAVLDSNHLKR